MHPMIHRPLWMSNFTRPSSRIFTSIVSAEQERLASLLIRDIGAFHDFVDLQRLLAKRAQDIFPVVQQNRPPAVINCA